ncbi:MAG: response regulator transcription factor [Bacteroidota bacterium]|jgi:DNA-binding NarL/FixJ family response regulator
MKKIRLLLIEDNRLLRDGITAMLKEQPDIMVVAASGTGEAVMQKIQALKTDIVLLDLGLRSQNSLETVKSIKKKYSEVRIIVMDLVPAQADVLEFVTAGVSGFILKDASIADFLKTIRSVAGGDKILPSHLTESLFSQIVEHAVNGRGASKVIESVRMTKRERQVIELITDGLTNKEIAQALHLSTYTVKSHVHNILEKLAMHTRLQIAGYAHTSETFQTRAETVSLINE